MFLFAKFLSFLSNPGFVVILAPLLIVYKASWNIIYAIKWELFSFLFISVGALFIFFGAWKGYFSDFDVSNKKERHTLYYFMVAISLIYLFFLFLFHAPRSLIIGTFSVSIGVLIMAVLNKFIKASIHVATMSAFIISLALWYYKIFWICLVLVFVIAWSRVKIKRHTVLEVLAGGIVGTLITFVTYFVVKYCI